MSKKAPIPATADPFGQAVKQNLDRITGQQRNEPPLSELPATATLAEVIAAYNRLLLRVQGE